MQNPRRATVIAGASGKGRLAVEYAHYSRKKDAKMAPLVSIQRVEARKLAAVRRRVTIGDGASALRFAMDQVWSFLRSQPGLYTNGHHVFLYHLPTDGSAPMEVDFGVEVTRDFDAAGDVFSTETPAGDVATAVHIGPYDGLKETHNAINAFVQANRRQFAGWCWEVYDDGSGDPSRLETTVAYLLE